MQANDLGRFAAAMGALGVMFDRDVNEFLIECYWDTLADLSIEEAEEAVKRASGRCKFFPRPAELLELAGQASGADRAVIAWIAVSKAVRSRGHRQSVDFDDPLVNASIRSLGGWETLCSVSADEFDTFRRGDFVKTYQALERSGAGGEAIGYLPGRDERECPDAALAPFPVACGLPPHKSGVIKAPPPVRQITDGENEAGAARVGELVGGVLDAIG